MIHLVQWLCSCILLHRPPQEYTRTGFNKVHRTVRVQGREVSLTVWDTSGTYLPNPHNAKKVIS